MADGGCHDLYDVVPWYMLANIAVTILASAVYVCMNAQCKFV